MYEKCIFLTELGIDVLGTRRVMQTREPEYRKKKRVNGTPDGKTLGDLVSGEPTLQSS